MGDKIAARNAMLAAGVPVAPGTPTRSPTPRAAAAAAEIGYPVMIKASGRRRRDGDGRGRDAGRLRTEYEKVTAFAGRLFGDPAVFVERYFPRVRHVEVQILGLADGRVLALGERDCSVQRRNQKVAEETPSPARRRRPAGADAGRGRGWPARPSTTTAPAPSSSCSPRQLGEFFFLEMNTRLQVEHPITERCWASTWSRRSCG